MTPRTIYHGGMAIDLENVKGFRLNTHINLGPTDVIEVEFKERLEYVFNPNTNKHELHKVSDVLKIPFSGFQSADVHLEEIREAWNDYLTERDSD